MKCKEIIVAYPHKIKFIDKNGGAISYYVDRKVSDCLKELQDNLSKVESENRQKDIDKLQLQSNWNSLREWLLKDTKDTFFEVVRIKDILDKMNELEEPLVRRKK